jgi:hypothetical protein
MNTTTAGGSAATTSRRITRGVTVTALTTILIAGLAACQTGSPVQGADTLQNTRVVVPQNVDTRLSADRIERELRVEPFNAAAAQLRALQKQYAGLPADRIERAIEDYIAAMRATSAAPRATGPVSLPADRLEQRTPGATGPVSLPADRLADRVE